METVVAHEVDAWEVQVATTLRALRRVEQPGMVRIGEFLDLLELRGGLEPIRRCQLFVLYARKISEPRSSLSDRDERPKKKRTV